MVVLVIDIGEVSCDRRRELVGWLVAFWLFIFVHVCLEAVLQCSSLRAQVSLGAGMIGPGWCFSYARASKLLVAG